MSEPDGADRNTELPGVCVVTHPLGPAGENATRSLLEILGAVTTVSLVTAYLPADSSIRHKHEVTEVTRQSAAQTTVVHAAVRYVLNQLRMMSVLYRREEGVVLFFGATAYILPILWAKVLGRTVILEPRGDVPLTLRLQWEERVPVPLARFLAGCVRFIERLGYRSADAIVTYTPSMAEELGLNRFEHKLHSHGARFVDIENFSPRTSFEERGLVIGFLGRLDEEKGIRTLANVAKQLPDNVTFRFIGDGELRKWLEAELANEIESGQVEMTGWIDHDEVPEQLSELRLLVMPSEPTEGLPTTILEAMACGTPVYASPVSGVPDVVQKGATGFLISKVEASAISREITTILEQEDLSEISNNARSMIETEFSFEASVNRYSMILSRISER